jgi:multiple sugar transport system permease protein
LFWKALGNSLFFIALAVPVRALAALLPALLLRADRRGTTLYRTAVSLPAAVPETAYAFMWLWFVNPLYGPINTTLGWLGLPAPGWLADPASAKYVFVMMAALEVGEGFLILLAAVRAASPESLDAARVDGANSLAIVRYILLPHIWPWLALLAASDLVYSFRFTFAASYFMTNGDPLYATLFLPLYAYQHSVDSLHFGYGAALAVVMLGMGVVAIVAVRAAARGSRTL